MPTNESFSGVSNCYVFKSRLQEYAQKLGLPTPVYETIKEGPSHEPSFRSTVIVNDVRYDSLLGFFNRKAAEQSAAEVALLELSKSGDVKECISQPVHETGLCKNLLQEYAQKMNYAIPLYECRRDETPGRVPLFSCTVEIGGIRYIGAAAKTKKEAEIKAARTALLAIQSSTSDSSETAGHSQFTVIPCKKRGIESVNLSESVDAPKPKKARFKKKLAKKKLSRRKVGNIQVENTGTTEVNVVDQMGSEPAQTAASVTHAVGYELSIVGAMKNSQEQKFAVDGALAPHVDVNLQNGQTTASNIIHDSIGTEEVGISSESYGDLSAFLGDANEVSGAGEVASMANNYSVGQFDTLSVVAGLNESGESIHPVSD